MINLKEMLNNTLPVAREAGRFLLEQRAQFSEDKVEYKGFNDLVSYVDKETEAFLVKELAKIFPEAGFLTEEDTTENSSELKDYRWVIDPLDGTTNFIHGLPVFAVSIALEYRKKPVIGIVYEPNRDECFYATAETPAFCNEEAIRVSDTPSLGGSLLATGFPYYNFKQLPVYLDILKNFMESTHGLRRMGSAAVDLVYVACGRFEGFFEYNLKPWDVAGGALIVQQAGGMVSTFSNTDDFVYGREIIAAGAVHPEMVQLIRKHWEG
jgi:myo-inositol-1(or 4)-monophosphatase